MLGAASRPMRRVDFVLSSRAAEALRAMRVRWARGIVILVAFLVAQRVFRQRGRLSGMSIVIREAQNLDEHRGLRKHTE
jgi:hypothetical protein